MTDTVTVTIKNNEFGCFQRMTIPQHVDLVVAVSAFSELWLSLESDAFEQQMEMERRLISVGEPPPEAVQRKHLRLVP